MTIEQSCPATDGGSGFVRRGGSVETDIRQGHVWTACGVSSEVAPLRRVLLSWPSESIRCAGSPDSLLFRERVDLEAIRAQAEELVAFYEAQNVEACLFRPERTAPPNFMFMRDTFVMTPEGAVVGRPAGQVRAGEERFTQEALTWAGVPVIGMVHGEAVLEGADVLWLPDKTVVVGVGFRTSAEGFAQLSRLLGEAGVSSTAVSLPAGTQHLLGVVNFVDNGLAISRADRLTEEIARVLRGHGVRIVVLDPTDEVVEGLAMNFVTLSPRRIVMPAGCPGTRRKFEEMGIGCCEVHVGEYRKAAGGPGCLTGILQRKTESM